MKERQRTSFINEVNCENKILVSESDKNHSFHLVSEKRNKNVQFRVKYCLALHRPTKRQRTDNWNLRACIVCMDRLIHAVANWDSDVCETRLGHKSTILSSCLCPRLNAQWGTCNLPCRAFCPSMVIRLMGAKDHNCHARKTLVTRSSNACRASILCQLNTSPLNP